MAEAHGTRMRMRGNHRGPIYLYKHICTPQEREGDMEGRTEVRDGKGRDEEKAKERG